MPRAREPSARQADPDHAREPTRAPVLYSAVTAPRYNAAMPAPVEKSLQAPIIIFILQETIVCRQKRITQW